jgi:hypothetical protein
MIAGHTRTLQDVDPLPSAITIDRRIDLPAERHTAHDLPDQLPSRRPPTPMRSPEYTGRRRQHDKEKM